MKDSLNRELKPGDVVVYPQDRASYGPAHAVVMSVGDTYITTCRIEELGYFVDGIVDRAHYRKEKRLCPKAYKVFFTDRVTILGISAAQLLELAGVN